MATRSLHHPHTLISFIAALACMAIATLPPLFLNLSRSQERRLYWSGVSAAAGFGAIAVLPDWKLSIGVAVFTISFMTASAYMNGSNIKIGNKVYAYYVSDTRPDPSPDAALTSDSAPRHASHEDPAPDSYSGIATAQKAWWMHVLAMVFIVFGALVPFHDKPWMQPVTASILVLMAVMLGNQDASWGYSIARGQRLQFAIIAVMTAGIFTTIYLLAFSAGRRWPWRPKRSGEYRAHPRFWPDQSPPRS
jgi:hypothetical protein